MPSYIDKTAKEGDDGPARSLLVARDDQDPSCGWTNGRSGDTATGSPPTASKCIIIGKPADWGTPYLRLQRTRGVGR